MYKIKNKGRYPFHIGTKTVYKDDFIEIEKLPENFKHQDGMEVYEKGKLIINADGVKVSPIEKQEIKKIKKKKGGKK